jgi:valyl-tRNA synthetase
MDFGTGAVKITPAHDPNDYLCGERHNLDKINIFDDNGIINENGGPYKGMKRFDCRNKILEDLQNIG